MGFRIENYSLAELHRIAVPGKVAPSLFWALPVGSWRPGDLDKVWQLFTEGSGECNDFGLLFVKDLGRRDAEQDKVDLAPVGAKLSDLMPPGTERFVRSSAYQGETPRVLVLSGGYPQPGWGVLVDWPGDGRRLEELIRRTIVILRDKNSSKLEVFADARQRFRRWRNLRDAPKLDVSLLDDEIHTAEKVESFVRGAQSSLQAGEYHRVGEKVIAAVHGTRHAAWLSIQDKLIQQLLEAQRTLEMAGSLAAVSKEVFAQEIKPKLAALATDPSHMEAAFRSFSSDERKRALTASIQLLKKNLVAEAENFQAWAQQTLAEAPATFGALLAQLSGDIEAKLINHRGVKAQREYHHELAIKEWRQNSTEAGDSFHVVVGKAVEVQWEIGPALLVAFEKICRQENLWVRSIPWDPARMVGWKIMASQVVGLNSRDLAIAAQELAPGAMGSHPINGPTTAVADGSYFTDYVHYIAISQSGFSPRAVTRSLLVRLLRPAEMMKLIQFHGGQSLTANEAPQLAEELLDALGWQQLDEVRKTPLAGCIQTRGDSAATIAENIDGNNIRRVLESFCKDIVDVVVTQLGYSHQGVWNAIEKRIPAYQPSSRTKDWEEEVRLLTVGGAVMILSALAPLAFPALKNEISEFATFLNKLSVILNKSSHDGEGEAPLSIREAPALICQILGKAEAFLGELPWHLKADVVYGVQPKVLSGEAWSHGCPTPRLLSVIVWTGEYIGTHVTLWNKTRRNPIVTDPVFIVRPGRS